jgi:hypothetical protein
LGNDWTPPEHHSNKLNTGILSSFVSSVSNAVMGDGTDVSYAGHPGASGSFTPNVGSNAGSSRGGYNPHASPDTNSTYTSPTGMTGFGNPNYGDARQEKSWMQKASEYISTKPTNAPPPVSFAAPLNSEYKFSTNRGPNAIGSSNESWKAQGPSVVPDLPMGAVGAGRTGGAASDGTYERSLIENLCEPSGLKPVPNDQKLADFLQSAPSLSAELIGQCLLDTLNSDAWQSRTKALMVIGQLVQANNCQGHMDFWCAHDQDLATLQQDSKAGVRTQANKLIKIISPDVAVDQTEPTKSKPTTVVASKVSLLDFDETPASNGAHLTNSIENSDSLFAGMSLGGSSAPVVQNSLPSTTSPQQPTNQAASMSAGVTISQFDFLSDSFSTSTPTLVAPPIANASHSNDLFGSLTVHSVVPQPPPQSTSSFDFLNSDTNLLSATSSPQPSTGFSFISGGAAPAAPAFIDSPQQSSNGFVSHGLF